MKNIVISNNKLIWSEEHKNLLLGEWCLEGIEKNFNSKRLNYEIQENFWSNEDKKLKNVELIQNKLWDEAIIFISKELNNYHKTNFNKKYWETVIAGWLIVYLPMLFERFETLKSIKENHQTDMLTSKIYLFDYECFIPNNTFHFRSVLSVDNNWNHWINSEIIKFLNINYKEIKKIDQNNNLNSSIDSRLDNLITKRIRKIESKLIKTNNSFLNILKNKIKKLFYFRSNIMILDCTITKLEKIYLYLICFSIPAKSYTPHYEISKKIDEEFRNINFEDKFNKNFFNFFKKMFYKNVPKSFLEDYKKIKHTHQSSFWPKKPKIILTSFANLNNDIFNNYCSEKRLNNSKLIIYQHGGTYKINKYQFSEFMEKKLADIYLTYGWKGGKKIHPFFYSTNKSEKNFKKDKKTEGIIISATNFYNIPNLLRPIPNNTTETKKYIKNINNFLNSLNTKIITSKLHVNYANFDRNPNLKNYVDNDNIKFSNIDISTINKSKKFRLIVETVNSTGFLENLYFNVPFIALFDKDYCPLNAEAEIDYQHLIKNNIIFYDSKKAAEHINKVYEDIDSWWKTDNLQECRKVFCKKYVKKSKNKYKEWKNIIKNIEKGPLAQK